MTKTLIIIRSLSLLTGFFAMMLGCNSNNNEAGEVAYLGGEIINPKNNVVVLYNTEGEVLDSLRLDANNRFLHKISDLKPGLYSITHGGEYQLVLLEPNDSLLFRLNTYDFDESLVFTGKGAKKNNYLIKTYLSNEREADRLVEYSKMEPEAFHSFVEDRRQRHLNHLNEFIQKNNQSDFFKSILEANINYNNFADKEIYPFAYFGNNKLVHVNDLPDNRFFSYNRFLFSHIDNLAINSFYENNDYHSKFDRHSMAYNKSKLDLIDSIITDETIKNNLLKYKARDFISHNHTEAEADEILEYYLEKSTNDKDKLYMTELVSSLKLLRQGNPLPNLEIVSYDNKEYDLISIIKKPTIIYFWSSNSKSQYRNSHYKVRALKNQFDYMDFVSINVNDNDDKFWKKIIGNYNFATTHEYKFKDSEKARKTLAVNYLNKAIIVDSDGIIIHPNVNIFSSDFSEALKDLMKKKHLIK